MSYVSDNYFDALGGTAALGTVFHARAGRGGEVVVTHRDWQRALAGDPAVLEHPLCVNDVDLRVIGVRVAPGAKGTTLGWQVANASSGLVGIGLALDAGLAYGGHRLLQEQLYGVSSWGPTSFLGAVVIVVPVSLAVTLQPAPRAARVGPIVALRQD